MLNILSVCSHTSEFEKQETIQNMDTSQVGQNKKLVSNNQGSRLNKDTLELRKHSEPDLPVIMYIIMVNCAEIYRKISFSNYRL
jgi:hypothetical protein